MQHKYVGDVGDYIKLAFLRQLAPNHRLGIVWWRFPDEVERTDGRHVDYLRRGEWRRYDPPLFDHLLDVVTEGRRDLSSLQSDLILPDARFFAEEVPQAIEARQRWLNRAVRAMQDCDLVFLDPDNGLEPRTYTFGTKKAGKSIAYVELAAFRAPGRTLVVYHHQTRRPGGHLEEIRILSERLGQDFRRVDAIRAKPYSPRVFFVLDAPPDQVGRMKELCDGWDEKLSYHSHSDG